MAYFLYVGLKKPNRKRVKHPVLFLILLRTMGLFFLSILLLSPYLKYESSIKNKPRITFVMDGSMSLNNQNDIETYYRNLIRKAKDQLKGYELRFTDLNGIKVQDSLRPSDFETNLTASLENPSNFSSYDQAIVLCSDGIINAGANPNFYPLSINKPIYTLGLGDTNTLKDIKVSNAKTNDFVLLGNDFPLEFNIITNGCKGERVSYRVSNNGKIVGQGAMEINANQQFYSKQIKVSATQPGVQRIVIQTNILDDEKNTTNNSLEVYVNVLDNRKKVSILYQGAHPDVKAIRTALKAQKNYEIAVTTSVQSALESDVIIAVQVPNRLAEDNASFNLINSKKPVLIVGGEMIDWNKWMDEIGNIKIRTAQPNQAGFSHNESFSGFTTEPEDLELMEQLPPLTVPFAVYPKNLNAMAYQLINGIPTNYPLIATSTKQRRVAIILGEGLWRWSMREFALTQNHQVTENLIDHLVQWLLSGQDKPLFSISSSKNRYTKHENVFLKAELYNQVFEPIKDAEVKGVLTKDSFRKEITLSNNGNYYSYNLGGLEPGNYQVNAKVKGKTARTGFSVSKVSQEERLLKANWSLLARLSENYDGEFFAYNQDDLLLNALNKNIDKTVVVKKKKKIKDLIQIPSMLMLIAFLFGLEWISRKYYGRL